MTGCGIGTWRRDKATAALIWSGASLVTVTAHVGVVAWMLHVDPVVAADSSPPTAIMLELAIAPEAMQVEMTDIASDKTSADENAAAQERKRQDEPQKPQAEEAKDPSYEKTVEHEVSKEKAPVIEEAEVKLPPERTEPAKKPEPKPARQKASTSQRASRASNAKRQAQLQTRQSDRFAAAQTSEGVAMSPATWQSRLMAHLESRKRYPSDAGGRMGIVYVRFTIDNAGNVLNVAVARSSGVGGFDQEGLAMVRRASPVPPPPPGVNRSITVPIRFNTN